MRANEIFDVKITAENELYVFTGRVLFWWEEQDIKIQSVYEEPTSQKLSIENSQVFTRTVNKFLLSIKSKDKNFDKDYLYRKSIEENKNIEWSDILHHSVIIPLYKAYIDMSDSSMDKMNLFRKKVMAAYDANLRAESFDDFPLPPELIEYDLLSTNGVLTRDNILQMSYSEMLKYQTIREIDQRYKRQKFSSNPGSNNPVSNANMGQNLLANQVPPQGMAQTPPSTMQQPQTPQQFAKEFFPEVTV